MKPRADTLTSQKLRGKESDASVCRGGGQGQGAGEARLITKLITHTDF